AYLHVKLLAATDGDGWHQPHVTLNHHLDDFLGEKIAVLHAVEATLDRVADCTGWTGVRGHLFAGAVRCLHHRAHFVLGQLRVPDSFMFAGDTARDADLDEVRACPELHAHRIAEPVGSVGFNGAGSSVAVPAGGDARHAGGED